jgi:hypothetical protein
LRLKKLKTADDSIGRALKTGDVNAYMEGNFNFHFLIYSAQPRRTLLQLIETLWLQFGPFMRVVYGRFGTANLTDQHELMIRALRRQDAAGLKRALADIADIRDGMGFDRRERLRGAVRRLFFAVVEPVEARRSDNLASVRVNGDERSAALQRFAEESIEDLFLITLFDRMLLPDERIRGYGEEAIKILGSQRPELQEVALQDGLQIEVHA